MRGWRKLHRTIVTSDRMPDCSFEALWFWTLLTVAQDDAGLFPWTKAKVRSLGSAYNISFDRAHELVEELVTAGIVEWKGDFIHLVNGEVYNGRPRDTRQDFFYEGGDAPVTRRVSDSALEGEEIKRERRGEEKGDAGDAEASPPPSDWDYPADWAPMTVLVGYKPKDYSRLEQQIRQTCTESGVSFADVIEKFAEFYQENRVRLLWTNPVEALRKNYVKDIKTVKGTRNGRVTTPPINDPDKWRREAERFGQSG